MIDDSVVVDAMQIYVDPNIAIYSSGRKDFFPRLPMKLFRQHSMHIQNQWNID